jgi:AmmeMemoRadiSam system protein B
MFTTTLRPPAVAGQFYPGTRDALLTDLATYLPRPKKLIPALGCIAPHAGYMYSGAVAGAVYSSIQIPERAVLLCPNHTGKGRPLSLMREGAWETPLGAVSIDTDLASALLDQTPLLEINSDAHRSEHAIEVQLPFLQFLRADLRFVPIAIGTSRWDYLASVGEALGRSLASYGKKTLIIASSDMNHYESDEITRVKDAKAIDRILALDPAGLYEVVMNEDISMCGYGPATIMLIAAKSLGATHAEQIRYATSGDVSGDRRMVVGYAGIAVR